MGGVGKGYEGKMGGHFEIIKIITTVAGALASDRGSENSISVFGSGWRSNSLIQRLDMPVFDGNNPEGWIFRLEHYFNVNQMMKEEK